MPYKDPEKRRQYNNEYKKRWRELNESRYRETLRLWSEKNRLKINSQKRERYYLNREKEIARVMKGNKLRYRKDRLNAIIHYGGDPPKCSCCGEEEYRFLTLHHVNNDGSIHRKELKSKNMRLPEFLRKNNYPEGFAVLCYNCNCAIGFFGKCPHEENINEEKGYTPSSPTILPS